MLSPERHPEKAPATGTIRHNPIEMNDIIMDGEELLARDPDSFAYKASLNALQLGWEKLFGMKRIPLSYVGILPDDVAKLIGPTGPAMLRKISGMVNVASVERKWPLEALEAYGQTDPEIEDMKNVLVVLKLRTSFDQADEILKSFYPKLDDFANSLSGDERLVVAHGIFFDIAVVPPEPNEN